MVVTVVRDIRVRAMSSDLLMAATPEKAARIRRRL